MSDSTPTTRARRQRGFTLVELLVVVTILGILAAVVVFAVGGAGNNAQSNACNTEAKTIRTAVQVYRSKSATNSTADPAISALVTDGELDSTPTLFSTIVYAATGSPHAVTSLTPSGGASPTCTGGPY